MIGQLDHSRMRSRRLPAMILCLVALFTGATDAIAGGEAVNNPVELQPFQALTETHERPLFSPSRRPPPRIVVPVVAARQEPPPAPPAPPSLVLLGIVSENGEARAAIRSADKHPADKVLRVRAGDDVSGWKVERVEPRRLVLTQGERSADFVLFGATAKGVKSADAAVRSRADR